MNGPKRYLEGWRWGGEEGESLGEGAIQDAAQPSGLDAWMDGGGLHWDGQQEEEGQAWWWGARKVMSSVCIYQTEGV